MRHSTIAFLIPLALSLLVAPLVAKAQQAGPVPQIGVLRALGGQGGGPNMEHREVNGQYERFPDLAAMSRLRPCMPYGRM
jgi:hypothetical protein